MSRVLGYFIDFNKDFKFLTSYCLRIDNLKLRNFYHQKIAVSYIKKLVPEKPFSRSTSRAILVVLGRLLRYQGDLGSC